VTLADLPPSKLLVLCAWAALGLVMIRRLASGSPAGRRDRGSWLGMGIQGAAFALAWTEWPVGRPAQPIVRATAVVLAFASVWMAGRAIHVLGCHWSLTARTLDAHVLVTEGPYASVRHPIYSAMLGLLVATTITFGRPITLAASIPIYVAGTYMRLRREERLLAAEFGDAWDAYAARVPALLPRWR
jgi:protein-S-isoprenylcysteine O-methyltransferase Ste14